MTKNQQILKLQKVKYQEHEDCMIFLEQDIPKNKFHKNIIDNEKF